MQVIAGGSACSANSSDLLSFLHYIADGYAHSIAVAIPCLYSVAMGYLDDISVRAPISRKGYHAVIHNIDRCSFWVS